MAHPVTLPALAGIALVAVAAGVQLGLGAVAEMAGARREAPPSRPFASLSPNRSPGGGDDTVLHARPEPAPAPMGIGLADLGPCPGCKAPSNPLVGQVRADRGAVNASIVDEPASIAEAGFPAVAGAEDIERSARYPPSSEEREVSVPPGPVDPQADW